LPIGKSFPESNPLKIKNQSVMIKRIIAIIFLVNCIFLSSHAQSNKTEAKHRVVLQLSSADTLVWLGIIHNIVNLRTALGDDVQIELVAHGPGIDFLVRSKTTQQSKIAELKSKGVVFAACANSLKGRNISAEAVVPEAIIVPSGVTEVVLKQEAGWSYLKAGY
jgi:uncharacterized protein